MLTHEVNFHSETLLVECYCLWDIFDQQHDVFEHDSRLRHFRFCECEARENLAVKLLGLLLSLFGSCFLWWILGDDCNVP